MLYRWQMGGIQLNYRWCVDFLLAGVIGYGAHSDVVDAFGVDLRVCWPH